MKQYTKEEIAARTKVVWLATDNDSHYKSICATEPIDFNGEFFCDQEPGCLPDNKWVIGQNKLHNPEQYPWPEPGQCVEYRLEPSLLEDLKGYVKKLQDTKKRLYNEPLYNWMPNSGHALAAGVINDLNEIINKHYPEV
jgi:hypothetical protein